MWALLSCSCCAATLACIGAAGEQRPGAFQVGTAPLTISRIYAETSSRVPQGTCIFFIHHSATPPAPPFILADGTEAARKIKQGALKGH